MTKVLLTGGSGFIAAHTLEQLLEKDYSVVTTVRSEEKAQKIRGAHTDQVEAGKLEVLIVPDIAQEGAFDEVALHASGSSVKRVVITSSFASIVDEAHFTDPAKTFTEADWNPVQLEDINRSPAAAYRASKKLAELAAWDFVSENKPSFDLVTICPPMVFGPAVPYFATLDGINTSNERVVSLLRGDWKAEIPASRPVPMWIDVRDAARAHIRALEEPSAGGQRLLTTPGNFSNREIADIVRAKFPEFADKLPGPEVPGGEFPPEDQVFKIDNSVTKKLLGFEWITLEKSITDLVTSLKEHGI
ncbi:hypothetical protein AUP68_04983 [Ilyonectria robusta]